MDVGWGSKATQFHGSEGKAAAAAAAAAATSSTSNSSTSTKPLKDPRGSITKDDDLLPRISWRNDGSFFFISSLDEFVPGSSNGIQEIKPEDENSNTARTRSRILRTFNRKGDLSSSSEEIKGLTHTIGCRPVGNLVATSQRFGTSSSEGESYDWGNGRKTRHDIIFFERNGLRHGGFSLREEEREKESDRDGLKQIDHRIKELKWNSDGNCLGILVTRFFESNAGTFQKDVLQLWTTMNYHWYLKSEISIPNLPSSSTSTSSFTEIKSFSFHPHLQSLQYHTSDSRIFSINHHLETHGSTSSNIQTTHQSSVFSSNTVSVIDGSLLKITPFSMVNTPPPMAPINLNLKSGCPRNLGWCEIPRSNSITSSEVGNGKEKEEDESILAVLYQEKVEFWLFNWGDLGDLNPKNPGDASNSDYQLGGGLLEKMTGPFLIGSHRFESPDIDPRQVELQITSSSNPSGDKGYSIRLGVLGSQYSLRDKALLQEDGLLISALKVSFDSSAPTEASELKSLASQFFSLGQTGSKKLISQTSNQPVLNDRNPTFFVSCENGGLWSFSKEASEKMEYRAQELEPLPQFCPDLMGVWNPHSSGSDQANESGIVGLSNNGSLYFSFGDSKKSTSKASNLSLIRLLTKDATSFLISGTFLIWTDVSHLGNFQPIATLFASSTSSSCLIPETSKLTRNLERGAFLICSVPSSMTLILQMPRGNLEIIYPRALVLEVVKRQLDLRRYGNAVRICRAHRIDLNLLVDYKRKGKGKSSKEDDPSGLLGMGDEKETRKFVRGVREVDHLNLFLSSLRNEDVTKTMYNSVDSLYSSEHGATNGSTTSAAKAAVSASVLLASSTSSNIQTAASTTPLLSNKVNRICSAVIKELNLVDPLKYLNSILTGHVRKTPPDYSSALSMLLKFKNEGQTSLVESSISYIIFLSDGDELFKVALGMYDFTLALLVAQHSSKKDPREYLPFLRNLKEIQPVELQRFEIDDYLGRHENAFKWLAKSQAEDQFEKAMEYLNHYELWTLGIEEWRNDAEKVRKVREAYGDHLLSKRKPEEAALGE